jgi:hypothetical protein
MTGKNLCSQGLCFITLHSNFLHRLGAVRIRSDSVTAGTMKTSVFWDLTQVVWQVDIDVSEKPAPSFFKAEESRAELSNRRIGNKN